MRRRLLAPLLVALATVVALLPAAPAPAYPGAPWFQPGQPYSGNFPDPAILRVGSTYYAYATNTGGSYLPAMSSSDLRTWVPRPAYDPGPAANPSGDPWFNDALPSPAAWAPSRPVPGRMTQEVWAPGAAVIGGRVVVYYAVRERVDPARYCISVATAPDPLGPFVDASAGCLQLDGDPMGSIDPQPFVDDDGTPWLLWKSEGVPGRQPTRLWSRRLSPDGLGFLPGSWPSVLASTDTGWEGRVIENPAMVRHGGKLYLFYSGNEWRSPHYAIGYAECASPAGPCTKSPANPLLASRGDRLGPGGPAPFLDASGRLQLGYHSWNAPFSDYPAWPACEANGTCTTSGQRRLAVEPVYGFGALRVGGPPPPEAVARPIGGACPPTVPEDGFPDVPEGNPHERAVDCVVHWQVARGATDGTYRPAGTVTREQMAGFLSRLVARCPAVPVVEGAPDAFPDDTTSVFAGDIDRLSALGVVAGRADGTYGPGERVTREQMASFLVRVADRCSGASVGAQSGGTDWFPDDEGSTHEGAIDRAAADGLAAGKGGLFLPLDPVARDQMGSFLARLLDLLVERGAAPRP